MKSPSGKFHILPSLGDALFFSLMVGIGELYFPAFGLAKGMTPVEAGLLSTLPLMIGSTVPLLFVDLIEHLRSIKKWVVWSAGFQAVSLLAMAEISYLVQPPIWLIFFIASLYFAAGFMGGPSWNFWMGSLITDSQAPGFFAQRLRLGQLGIILGLVGGGLALHGHVNFAVLFILAFVFRMISVGNLSFQPSSSALQFPQTQDLKKTFEKFAKTKNAQKFFSFLFVFYVMIFISGPFVPPYFLVELKMNYQQFMWALLALLAGKMLIFPWGPALIRKWGVRTVFFVGAAGISPMPAVLIFARSFEMVIAVQILSGMLWALFELGFSVIFFNHLKQPEKIPMLSLFNFFNSLAILLGSLIGAFLLHNLISSDQGYNSVFAVGATLRLATVLIFYRLMMNSKSILQEDEGIQASYREPLKAQT